MGIYKTKDKKRIEKMKGNQRDLTQGSVWKQLLIYSIPMVTTSILQALYSMIDMIIVGRYVGNVGISAINNSSQLTAVITNIAIGLTVGGNVIIGQYFGSGDKEKRKYATGTLFTVSILLGIISTVIFYIFAEPILIKLGAPALKEAVEYLRICAWGLPFIFGYNALSAVLRAVGNSKKPLHFILVSTILNVVLDIVFVGYWGMGTGGAALATVISQGVSFILALIYVLTKKDIFELTLNTLKIRKSELAIILRLGIPCAVQMTVAAISWLVVTFIINQYGVDVSAGNGVSIKIKDFCQLFIAAMANGAATMIAQTLGAKKYDRAKEVMYTAMKITVSMAVVLIIIVEIFAPQLVSIFNKEPAVIAAAVVNLRIEIIGQVFYAMFLVYHSLAIGAGHTMFAFGSSFVNCILVRLVLSITLNHFFGLPGLYLACTIAPSSSVPLGYFYTKSNVWRRSLIDEKA